MERQLAVTFVLVASILAAAPVRAQPTTFVNRLGIDQDVRSGM
jgi:hypothetical protein